MRQLPHLLKDNMNCYLHTNTMLYIKHHIHPDLNSEYVLEEEYNHVVHKIYTKLQFYKKEPSN
jgi:hypothetical protein